MAATTVLPVPPLPLARYLPPLPAGMVAAWLAENVAPGSWVLDPLGASPAAALEAARAGYRVLVASNNPVISFIIETLASAPKPSEFQAALAELAISKRGDERLERHILGLYLTECDNCGEHVTAQSFLWRKGEAEPFARVFRCPKCGEGSNGQPRPVTKADLDRLSAMGGDKLQRARALQRVILNEEEHRADVEEALENYLTRPLYVLFTLLNKIEGLGLPLAQQRLLQALLLSAFDAGSTLWPWPGGRSRPKQLSVPPQFRENNLWLALEDAVEEWAQEPAPVSVTHWPEQPQGSSGICLYRGRVKALMPLPEESLPRAVLTVFPRPNQAFWTLSVLWAGWLWGAEAALPLRNVLERRRFDWNWHTSAIHNALSAVGSSIPAETPFFGILPELAPGFLSAVIVAAETSGFRLQGLALRADATSRAEMELAQGTWLPAQAQPAAAQPGSAPGQEALEATFREAIRADLLARSEPAAYLTEYAAGMSALARSGIISGSPGSIPSDLLARVQAGMARTFANRSFLRRYDPRPERAARSEPAARNEPAARLEPAVKGEKITAPEKPRGETADEERSLWWLAAAPELPANYAQAVEKSPELLPLSDRVEMEVVRFLQKRPGVAGNISGEAAAGAASETLPGTFTWEELDQALCGLFPGLLTPPVDLVRACLESYGEQTAAGSWRMRASETSPARRADLREMRAAIETVGRRLGYTPTEQGSAIAWMKGGQAAWWFFRMASSILSRYVLAAPLGPLERCVLVLPGSRARLLAYKLRRDPRLAGAVQGWRFLKFRHLREIAGAESVRPEDWAPLLDEDPLTDEATQMELFST